MPRSVEIDISAFIERAIRKCAKERGLEIDEEQFGKAMAHMRERIPVVWINGEPQEGTRIT